MYGKINLSLLLMCLVACSAPFIFVPVFFGDYAYYVFVGGLTTMIITILLVEGFDTNFTLVIYFIITIGTFYLIGLIHAINGLESEVIRLILGLMIKFVMVIALFNGAKKNKTKFAQYYINLCYYISVPTIILGLLLSVGLWPFGYNVITLHGNRVLVNFYISFVSSLTFSKGVFARLSSYLDEPGSYGFFVAIALILTNFVNTSKLKRQIIIIGGLFSFSFAYYIFLPLYAIYLFREKIKLSNFIVGAFTIILIVTLYQNVIAINTMAVKLTQRFEFKDDKFVGDNRFYNAELPTDILFGDGLIGARDSIISEIRNIGIIGVITLYLPIFLLIIKLIQRKDTRFYLILLILVLLMQRPVITKMYVYLPIFWILFTLEKPKKLTQRR
jgi:hypothetical protein